MKISLAQCHAKTYILAMKQQLLVLVFAICACSTINSQSIDHKLKMRETKRLISNELKCAHDELEVYPLTHNGWFVKKFIDLNQEEFYNCFIIEKGTSVATCIRSPYENAMKTAL